MGWFRHSPQGAHDLAHLTTKRLKESLEYYKQLLAENPKCKVYKQLYRKYDYEFKRRSDAEEDKT